MNLNSEIDCLCLSWARIKGIATPHPATSLLLRILPRDVLFQYRGNSYVTHPISLYSQILNLSSMDATWDSTHDFIVSLVSRLRLGEATKNNDSVEIDKNYILSKDRTEAQCLHLGQQEEDWNGEMEFRMLRNKLVVCEDSDHSHSVFHTCTQAICPLLHSCSHSTRSFAVLLHSCDWP